MCVRVCVCVCILCVYFVCVFVMCYKLVWPVWYVSVHVCGMYLCVCSVHEDVCPCIKGKELDIY